MQVHQGEQRLLPLDHRAPGAEEQGKDEKAEKGGPEVQARLRRELPDIPVEVHQGRKGADVAQEWSGHIGYGEGRAFYR